MKEVRVIAETGAVSLALNLVDEHQNGLTIHSELERWLQWERERIALYQLGERWDVLQKRIESYQQDLPSEFYLWAKQQQVDALLTLKQADKARQILQVLVWSEAKHKSLDDKVWLSKWQKRIIKSYLIENNAKDALLASQRYYQDYAGNDIDDRLLRARILLANNREDEVVALLAKDTRHPQGGMLYLLAQLRSNARPAQKVWQAARRQMRGKWASEELKYMLWAVAAEAAKRSGDRPSAVNALEFVLAGHKNTDLPAGLFNFSADTLWNSYIDYALHLGNKAQFLVGNDKQWLQAAARAEKKYPVRARSFYALIMLRGQDETMRMQAVKGFLNLMHKRKRGAELVMKLYLKSSYYESLPAIPKTIRFDLIDIALSRSNIELASNLMATIESAPDGLDNYQWQLRRARIFVLGGKVDKGSETLKQLIEQKKVFTKKELDQFLQVVFDLQTLTEHEHAYQLFYAILPKINETAQQREIFFWMADSQKAQQNYLAAATLYLRSALHADNNGLDPWGQTARYQTAEMLAEANLLKDALVLYEKLLATTKEPARRAVLKHEIQKLWLLKNNSQDSNADE